MSFTAKKYQLIVVVLSAYMFFSCSQPFTGIFIREGDAVPKKSKMREWTIMLYMAADNNLESDAIQDINALESLDFSSKNISVLSLLDRSTGYDETNNNWSETRLLEVSNDPDGVNGVLVSKELDSSELALFAGSATELDMANKNTLKSFIEFSYEHYNAENYALIIWGHGGGWRSVISDSNTRTAMDLASFRNAVELSTTEKKLSVISFDASFGATLETLWEAKNLCTWFTGTSGTMSQSGFDYKNIFSNFLQTPCSVEDFVQSMNLYQKNSSIKMDTISEIKVSFDEFTRYIALHIDNAEKQTALKNLLLNDVLSYKASTYPTDMYINIYDFVTKVVENVYVFSSEHNTQEKIRALGTNLQSSLVTATGGKSEKAISVFLISYLADGIPDSVFPHQYVQSDVSENLITFVKENDGWVPTNNKITSLLDKAFFTVF